MGLLKWFLQTPQEWERERREANRPLYCGGCGGTSIGGYCPGPHHAMDRQKS